MNGRGAKQKGMRGEYQVRDLLQEICDDVCAAGGWAPLVIERNVDQVRSFMGNQKGSDISGLPWFAIEVKYRENDSGWNSWWNQTKEAAWVYDEGGPEVGPGGRKGRYQREPILFSRRNHAPWEIRMFGYLVVSDVLRVRVPVDVTLPDFLLYFRNRMKFEMMKSQLEGGIDRSGKLIIATQQRMIEEGGKGSRPLSETTLAPSPIKSSMGSSRVRPPWEKP